MKVQKLTLGFYSTLEDHSWYFYRVHMALWVADFQTNLNQMTFLTQ